MSALTHIHSGLRWIVLLLVVFAIVNAFMKTDAYTKKDKMVNLFAMLSLHIQLLIGLALYFSSSKVQFVSGFMKSEMYRFYGMEHFVGMLLAILVITIGRKKAENKPLAQDKHKAIKIYYIIGLVLILAFIPWPFRESLGGAWF